VTAIVAREYQTRAIDAGRASFRAGKRAVLFVGPTGCGKTTIFSMMAQGRVARGGRVAVFAHRIELVQQAADRLRAHGLEVGANGAGKGAPVQVTSVQTCLARKEMPEADLVILDEAHHYVADLWNQVPATYAAKRTRIVGFTATPERADGVGLGDLFDDLVVVAQIAELTALGWLVPCEVLAPATSVTALAQEPWQAVQRHAPGRSAVVFAPHIKAAHEFADGFVANGVAAGVVHAPQGDCDRGCAERRAETLARFAAGELTVVVNVNVLTEGWDCPRAKVCVLARLYGSPSQFLQAVGRVLRPLEGAGDAMLLDLAGNVDIHGTPDEARLYSLTGAACSRASDFRDGVRICRTCKAEIPPTAKRCEACGRELPVMVTPTAEDVALARFERDEARARLPEDRRVKILTSLYAKTIRKGHKRTAAEHAYRGMFKHHPPADVSAVAWMDATTIVAKEKGDAWEPAS
jgi:superfamily II DNA or RNA helicase